MTTRLTTAIGSLTLVSCGVASAAIVVHPITGEFGATEHACSQVAHVLGGYDCSYGRNWPGGATEPDMVTPVWGGPYFGGAHYLVNSAGDSPLHVPATGTWSGSGTSFTPASDDGKYKAPITGSFSIDDNDTPADPSDDKVSASFSIGAMARNVPTGQSSRVVQRWTTMDHVMAPTTVSSATPNGAGGIDYVIGSRGLPGPLCNRNDPGDCFPTANASGSLIGDYDNDVFVGFWQPIDQYGVGVERTGQLGDPGWWGSSPKPPPNPPTGNVGATTAASFTGYSCDAIVATDCATSTVVWGAGESAGFDNLVMKIATDSSGAIAYARAYWTQEYFISAFGAIQGYDNSVQYGVFSFAGTGQPAEPDAIDDVTSTGMGQPVQIAVLANDEFLSSIVYVGISSNPDHGTVVVSPVPAAPAGVRITYTPLPGYIGPDSFEYWVESGLTVDVAHVQVTVLPLDTDQDGLLDSVDNCIARPNPGQCDSDADGYGNLCDGDLTGNGFTNSQDLVVLRLELGKPSIGPAFNKADLNCSGNVNAQDLTLFRQMLGVPPGPSGLNP
ncbi:MAG: hypothetical protein J0M16_03565 [Gammaproteobacteria bacterium]|nr:hypothetical protein [Gammaproteobacteria bacterium]